MTRDRSLDDTPPPPANGWAKAALVLGVCSLVLPVLGLGAILCGLVALPKSRNSGGKGKAVAGIMLGLFTVVFGTLVGIIAVQKLRTTAAQQQCLGSLRDMVPGINAYVMDHKGFYPPDLQTLERLKYVQPAVPTCPSGHSYTWVAGGQRSSQIAKPSATLIAYDAVGAHTKGRMIALFADGHGEELSEVDTKQVLADVEAGKVLPVVGTSP
jgi:hypothetical protein